MAVFTCKCCNAALPVDLSKSTVTCEYCGITQTLPNEHSDDAAAMFERANTFRKSLDFDRAASVYEKIVERYPEEAEAYWGLVLCKYGITYEEDARTGKRIPTCSRTVEKPVRSDPDYQSAIKYANDEQRELYENDAAEFDRLLTAIINIVKNEKPYDIFISYKRTDNNGNATPDSVEAYDLYRRLTREEGYKVFFAQETLKDKIGTEFEPYIFAALTTSKVMLVVGMSPENFTAGWVKNEWIRFKKLYDADPSNKHLIPCYKNMSIDQLPQELQSFQAQDMSALDFRVTLTSSLERLFKNSRSSAAAVIPPAGKNNEQLLKRAEIFVGDGEWHKAKTYCEKVLDMEPTCYKAYLLKLMAEVECRNEQELDNCDKFYLDNYNFEKAVCYGSSSEAEHLRSIGCAAAYKNGKQLIDSALNAKSIVPARESIDKAINIMSFLEKYQYEDSAQIVANSQELRTEVEYSYGIKLMESAETANDLDNAQRQFNSISGYKDSDAKAKECVRRIKEINAKYYAQKARRIFFAIGDIVVPFIIYTIIGVATEDTLPVAVLSFFLGIIILAALLISNFQLGYLVEVMDLDGGCLAKIIKWLNIFNSFMGAFEMGAIIGFGILKDNGGASIGGIFIFGIIAFLVYKFGRKVGEKAS